MLRDSYDDCAASADTQVAPIDAQAQDLAANWNPSAYFEPETLRAICEKQKALIAQAFNTLDTVAATCATSLACQSVDLIHSMRDNLIEVDLQADRYIDAVNSAESSASAAVQTVYVEAPNVKTWALDTLNYLSSAMHAANVVSCMMPWWASALSTIIQLGQGYVSTCKSVLGVGEDVVKTAVATGQAALQVAKEGFNLIAWVTTHSWTLFGMLVVGAGAFVAYKNRERLGHLKSAFSKLRKS